MKPRKHSTRDKGFVEFQGKRHYLKGGWNSPEMWSDFHRFKRENVNGEPPADANISHLIIRYLDYAKAYYGDSEFTCYRECCRLLKQEFAGIPLEKFTPRNLKAIQAIATDWSPNGIRWTRQHINRQMGRIRKMFRWAVSEGMVSETVSAALKTVEPLRKGKTTAIESQERPLPSMQEVIDTLHLLPPVVRGMANLHLLTGCRPQDICSLRPEHIDTTGDLWVWNVPKHKTEHLGHARTIYLGDLAKRVLRPFLDRKGFCFSPRETIRQQGRTPPPKIRDHYDRDSYRRAVKRASKKAGCNWTPHDLRHIRGTFIKARYGEEAAQACLGHASIDATKIYTRRLAELAMEVARECG